MTLTMQILKLLADGVPRTSEQIMSATGKSRAKVTHSLVAVRRQDWIQAQPVVYSLTASGVERSTFVPTTDPVRLARQAKRIAERRAIKLAGIEQKAALIAAQTRARIANRMVERDPEEIAALAEESIRSVRFTPNSVFAMGMR